MKSKNNRLLLLTVTSVMTALVCVMTTAVKIPSPTRGYLNLGDCFVLLGGWALGPAFGFFAGGVGSALADILAGYPIYAPGTLLVKGLMAWIFSLLLCSGRGKQKPRESFNIIFGGIIAEIVMICGYYLYEAMAVAEGFGAALAGIPENAMQGLVGMVSAYFLIQLIKRTGTDKILKMNRIGKDKKKHGKQ